MKNVFHKVVAKESNNNKDDPLSNVDDKIPISTSWLTLPVQWMVVFTGFLNWLHFPLLPVFNGSQLAKMKKSIPDMSLP